MMSLSLISIIYSNSVFIGREITILISRTCMILLISSVIFCFFVYFIKSLSKGIGMFNSLFIINNITVLFQGFIYLLNLFILGLNSFYPRKVLINKMDRRCFFIKDKILNIKGEQFSIVEYPLIMLFVLIGGSLLMSTGNIISMFLSIELQSYALYILCTVYRDSESSTKGGLMYFLLGGLSSCFILLGSSILYTNTGITNLDNLYVLSNISLLIYSDNTYLYSISLSLLVITVGLLIKISAAPFHFWSPDVYDMIPTIVTTFVAIISKISIFVFLLELVFYLVEFNLKQSILISSLFSLIIGTVLGLTQSRIKKVYAYSSISHIGFMLLCLNICNVLSIKGFIFYLISYSITNLNVFLILLAMGFYLYIYTYDRDDYDHSKLSDYNNSPIQFISQIKGYYHINPALALSLAVCLFSFIGIPPLIGFFAKQMVLNAALDKGYFFMSLVAILTSVIGAVYYLNVINEIFFKKSDFKFNKGLKKIYFYIKNDKNILKKNLGVIKISVSNFLTFSISFFTVMLYLFFFFADEAENFSLNNAIIKFNLW